jgi:hypothetical protein
MAVEGSSCRRPDILCLIAEGQDRPAKIEIGKQITINHFSRMGKEWQFLRLC